MVAVAVVAGLAEPAVDVCATVIAGGFAPAPVGSGLTTPPTGEMVRVYGECGDPLGVTTAGGGAGAGDADLLVVEMAASGGIFAEG